MLGKPIRSVLSFKDNRSVREPTADGVSGRIRDAFGIPAGSRFQSFRLRADMV